MSGRALFGVNVQCTMKTALVRSLASSSHLSTHWFTSSSAPAIFRGFRTSAAVYSSPSTTSRPACFHNSGARHAASSIIAHVGMWAVRQDYRQIISNERGLSSKSSQQEGNTGSNKSRVPLWVWGCAAGGVAVAYSSYANYFNFGRKKLHGLSMPAPEGFCEDFRHPYLKTKSYLWRLQLLFKRIIVIAWCFMPFMFASLKLLISSSVEHRKQWLEALVVGLEQAGCSFQKFGQWLSMRPDMVPPDVIEALVKLRQDAPVHSMEETRQEMINSWGVELEEVFDWFDPTPVASGSVAQVHKAKLRPEHAMKGGIVDVAVKVRHPEVLQDTLVDIDLIFAFINVLGEVVCHLTIPFRKHEFQQILQKQLDFRWEAYNLLRFEHNFQNDRFLQFPSVCVPLLSSGLLVETWMEGETVSSIFTALGEGLHEVPGSSAIDEKDSPGKAKKVRMAKNLFDMTMKMFLRDNLVHGDLHGGNVLYQRDKDTMGIVDGGLTTHVDPSIIPSYFQFLKALCTGDTASLVKRLIEFSETPVPECELGGFRDDMQATVDRWVGKDGRDPSGGPIQLGDMVGGILFNLQKHQITLRGDVAGTIVSMSLLEGLVRSLDPTFDVTGSALPYFVRFPIQAHHLSS